MIWCYYVYNLLLGAVLDMPQERGANIVHIINTHPTQCLQYTTNEMDYTNKPK